MTETRSLSLRERIIQDMRFYHATTPETFASKRILAWANELNSDNESVMPMSIKRLRNGLVDLKAKAEALSTGAYRDGLLDAYGFALSEIDAECAHVRALDNVPEFYEPESVAYYWRCKTCGCRWRDNRDGTVSLFDVAQKSCAECEHKPTPDACEWVAVERSPSPAALSTSENLKEMQRLSGLIEVWNGDLSEMVILQTAMTMTARQYLRELAVERGTAPPEKDAL
jgi:hypothetical protein